MFDSLLKSRFYSRCKSEIKLTMKRIEIIRRKRSAMQKFLRNDVADLLKTGLDSNAYDRVGQLYADQNLSWCYELLEQSCLLVSSLLSTMNKQRECPEECRQAVSTLMFAAARFADLPELRELRSLFAERYGNYLEPYVNQEFVNNLKADPPTKQIKLQMMQEIAIEYGIKMDTKALEQQKHKNSTVGNKLPFKSRAKTETKKEEKRDHGRISPYWSSNSSSCSESATSADDSASEDITQGRKFYAFGSMASTDIKIESTKTSTISDDNLQSGRPQGRRGNGLGSMGPPYIKPDLSNKTGGSNVKDDNLKSEEETEDISKPVPRSTRFRRPLKQTAGSTRESNDILKTNTKISNGENSFGDYNDRDEEEKVEKLLSHYSRKPSHLHAPKRTGSLPCEPIATVVAVDERKGLSRAVTYQPDSGLGHVHPKLPDYDDFVARLAAFRASS